MSFSVLLFKLSDAIGVIAFALSGAMIGLRYKLDLFGILTLGVVTALGGGVIRDLCIGRIPPIAFRNSYYVLLALGTSTLLFLLARSSRSRYWEQEARIEATANIFDAIGLGAFTVVGMQAGIHMGYGSNGLLLVFLSLITGIGGGIIRDLLVRRMPVVLQKDVYAVAVLAGALVYLAMYRCQVQEYFSIPVTIGLVFCIRMLATRYHWNLPRVN